MSRRQTAPKAIRAYFYEPRVLIGRDFTVKPFAAEALGGAVDPVMLGYIEKGKRLIAIGAGVARRNARRNGRSFRDELCVLILHGTLHLLGYDHETDNGRMNRLELSLRRRLGLE